jgi:hypothetical protein
VGKRECEASRNAGSEPGAWRGQCAHLDDIETAGIIEIEIELRRPPGAGRTPQLKLRSSDHRIQIEVRAN